MLERFLTKGLQPLRPPIEIPLVRFFYTIHLDRLTLLLLPKKKPKTHIIVLLFNKIAFFIRFII